MAKNTHGYGPARTPGHAQAGGARDEEGLIPKHGGYRNTKTWRIAELIYDITVLFCEKYVDRRSRTHDQMVQAARSGSRNIAEGSMDSGTSKKIEMKLTGIARGSLDELQGDYEAFLRHHGLPQWPPNHPALTRFKALRCATLQQFRAWVADEVKRARNTEQNTDLHGPARTGSGEAGGVHAGPCGSVSPGRPGRPGALLGSLAPRDALPATLAANGVLSLLNLCLYLLTRQLDAQARAFEEEGGSTERLYHRRSQHRRNGNRG